MARPPSFHESDLTRALRAATKAGQEVRRVEIHTKEGSKIVLRLDDEPDQLPPGALRDRPPIVL